MIRRKNTRFDYLKRMDDSKTSIKAEEFCGICTQSNHLSKGKF